MTNITATLRHATEQLEAVSDTPRLDAELLMAHALDMERGAMLLAKMRDPAPAVFGPMLLRRLAHEPLAYITGKAEFWSLPLSITADVLIPRADSETLIAAAQQHFSAASPTHILDLGTGSGALLLAALSEWPEAEGIGVDQSAAALAVAHNNADHLELADRCTFLCQSWYDMDCADLGQFDLILCNPPYVENDAKLAPQVRDYEPHQALFAGPEGLDDYRHLIPLMPQLLAPKGIAIFEIGATQAEKVCAIAEENRLLTQIFHDLAGHPRAVTMRQQADDLCK